MITILQKYGGKEYCNNSFNQFLDNQGILHQINCRCTLEQNGTTERKHRHLIKTTRILPYATHLPYRFGMEDLQTVVHLINRMPSPNIHNKSPYHLLFKRKPQYDYLRVFGCACFPWIHPPTRHKLARKTTQCIFIGYDKHHKGYRCYDPLTKKLTISRHVVFL